MNKLFSRRKYKEFILSLLPIALLLTSFSASSADGDYAVSRIPVTLLKNANAVVRIEDQVFEIKSPREAIHSYRYVITILNENGERWAEFSEYYDKMREVNSVQGFLYDAYGKQLKKIKTKDLQDLSGGSDNNLIDDNRVKRHNFYYKSFPYTVEYEVEIRYKYTLFFPMWTPQAGDRLAVEKSYMSIVCPGDYQFRSKAFNYKGDPVITNEKDKRITKWSIENMPAYLSEPFQPMHHEITTLVVFGPSEFQVGDYKGNMQSWEDFGRFIYALKKDRDVLPPDVKAKIHQLSDGITDVREKVRVLYEYMQANTRYISIQLGIGGWQPFEASYVASKAYGDCKALTNYMYSILKEVGIKSGYTVVRAGRNETYITDDFPSQQFNHVILCVPLQKDSIWLECTSQTEPTGYMGGFTGNRLALYVDENGGALVRTPRYGLEENLQIRRIKATLSEDATLRLKAETRYTAIQQDNLHMLINNLSKEKIKERLQGQLDFPTYDITDFNYKEKKSSLPWIDETLDISVKNFATISGKRLFLQPNIMTKSYNRLSKDETRKFDLQLRYSYRDIDTVELEIPQGFTQETKMEDVSIESRFGKYSSSTRIMENKLYHYRKMEQYEGKYSASHYNELVDFYDKIYKADRTRLVFVKNDTDAPKKAF